MPDAGDEPAGADGAETAGAGRHYDADELAGVVDLFGGLTRRELRRALDELAFRDGRDVDGDDADRAIREAVTSYHLLSVTGHDETETAGEGGATPLLVAGPVAFPTLPARADDLPHILDVSARAVDGETLASRVRERLGADVDRALADGDEARAAELVDVTYDAEAWVAVDLADVRERLETVLDEDRSNSGE